MSSVAHDLARWDAGELTFAELENIHPAHEINDLVALDAQLTMVTAAAPIPDLDGWDELAATLSERRAPLLERVKIRVQRPIALALVGTVVSTSAAVAAVPPVRRAVTSAVTEVRQFLFGEDQISRDVDRGAPAKNAAEVQLPAPSVGLDGGVGVDSDDDASTAKADKRRDRKAAASATETSEGGSEPSEQSGDSTSSSDAPSSSSGSSDSSSDSSEDGTDRSSDESSDSSSDGESTDGSSDSSEDCSSESDECWDGTTFDPDDF